MKIAFTSCFHPFKGKPQPVWDRINGESPQTLLLLGDAVYLDVNGLMDLHSMSESDFMQYGLNLYRAQLAQPQFKAVIENPNITTYAIWDDHDFLGNGSNGADLNAIPAMKPKVAITSALFNAFRGVVKARNANQFPSDINDPSLSTATTIGYQAITLPGTQCRLHLTDGRSFRQNIGANNMLGTAQRAAIAVDMKTHSEKIHLIASGVTFGQGGDRWQKYPTDAKWLLELAAKYKCLMLSGDIHENDFQTYATTGFPLHDATASGAAIRKLVGIGRRLENYGTLEVDTEHLTLSFHSFENAPNKVQISITDWQATVL